MTNYCIVREWIYTASQAALDQIPRDWSQRILEVVSHHPRLPDYHLRSQRRGLGRHALPIVMQRRACYVYSNLQRHQLSA